MMPIKASLIESLRVFRKLGDICRLAQADIQSGGGGFGRGRSMDCRSSPKRKKAVFES